MAKPEWGDKQSCESCGARFYDLGRKPIVCPKCDTELPPRPTKRRAGARAAAAEEKAAAPKATVKKVEVDDAEAVEDEAVDDEDDEDGIEDPSVLGGDDEDVAEVIAPALSPRVEET